MSVIQPQEAKRYRQAILVQVKGESMKTSQAEQLLINLDSLTECKGSIGFKIAYNIRKLSDELKEYVQFKQELFKKYGEEVEGNLVINKESENFPLFIKELNELDTEIEIPLMKFNEKDLVESGLTAKQMAQIWELVDGNN